MSEKQCLENKCPLTVAVETKKEFIEIDGMVCGACSSTVQRTLDNFPGIDKASVSLMLARAQVVYNPSETNLEDIIEEIEDVGFDARRMDVGSDTGFQLEILEKDFSDIANLLRKHDAVTDVKYSPQSGRITVEYALDAECQTFGPRTASEIISKAGFHVVTVAEGNDVKARKARIEENQRRDAKAWLESLLFSAKFTIPLLILHMICSRISALMDYLGSDIVNSVTVMDIISCLLSTPVQYYCGGRFYTRAYSSILNGNANMDVLIAVGTTAAYGFSWFALFMNLFRDDNFHQPTFETSASLLFVVSLGKWMETKSKGRTSEALTKLMDLQPSLAKRKEGDKIINTEVHLLQINDIVQVLRGEKFPVDGEVVAGVSSANESLITGESMPVPKKAGTEVIGGTINLENTLDVKVSKVGSDTVLAKIVKLVEDAQSSRAPVQAVADRIAQYFVPIVFLLSFITFISWFVCITLGFTEAVHNESHFVTAFMFSISVMVISCPCALGLATPTAVMVATGRAAELNILFKGGEVLEACGNTTCVAFDKTGTLTRGQPVVNTVVQNKGSHQPVSPTAGSKPDDLDKDLYSLILSCEQESEHLLGKAICDFCKENGGKVLKIEEFEATSGYGVRAIVDGREVLVGNQKWMINNEVREFENLMPACIALQEDGETVVYVAVDKKCEVILGIRDPIKDDAEEVISWLHNKGFEVWMITGDNLRTARSVGKKIGIPDENIRAEVDPKNKAIVVQQLQNMIRINGGVENLDSQEVVAFVGDGINDSPSLVKADVGIAIGSGTDVAIASAGVVLMQDNLQDVIVAFHLAKNALQRIYMNFGWALLYNVLMIPLAAGALYPVAGICLPPFIAGICMALSSISVVFSSLHLKRYSPPNIYEKPSFFQRLRGSDKGLSQNSFQNPFKSKKKGTYAILRSESASSCNGDALIENIRLEVLNSDPHIETLV